MSESVDKHNAESRRPVPVSPVLLVAVLVLACVAAVRLVFFAPPVRVGPAKRAKCKAQLKNIGLAFLNYADEHGHYPPAYVADDQGRPMHSWRVLILPYIECETTFDAYDFDQPWNSRHNLALADQMPKLYRCLSDAEAGENHTSYVMLVGDGVISDGPNAIAPQDLLASDGFSSTMVVAEMSQSGIHWMEPRDLDLAKMSFKINASKRTSIRSEHTDGAQAVFADGAVHYISDKTDPRIVRALITASGGEAVAPEDFEH